MRQCVSDVLLDTPVLAVAGNHDYPRWPSPMIREDQIAVTVVFLRTVQKIFIENVP